MGEQAGRVSMAMRARSLLILIALVFGACGVADSPEASAPADPRGVDQVTAGPPEDVPSALDNPHDESFPEPLIDPLDLRSGGPPPDGIPSIDEPKFEAARSVDWLEDSEPVLALSVGDDHRAYPIQIMTWHEIVNDTVGGIPLAVTYCPLCNSAIAFDRRTDERVLDFGTSGMLYRSALVMYDRQTESLWTHFTGEAVIGFLAGTSVDSHPVAMVAWSDFLDAHPEGLVLSRDTGFDRSYGRNPYPGYDDVNTSPFLFDGEDDGRFPAKTRVVGVERGDDSVAVLTKRLMDERVVEIELDDTPLTVWLKPGTASALDDSTVAGGRDVGATGVFEAVVNDRQLHFKPAGDFFADRETGTHWDILGRARSGPLEGATLTPVPHVDTFWFAWSTYQPSTAVER